MPPRSVHSKNIERTSTEKISRVDRLSCVALNKANLFSDYCNKNLRGHNVPVPSLHSKRDSPPNLTNMISFVLEQCLGEFSHKYNSPFSQQPLFHKPHIYCEIFTLVFDVLPLKNQAWPLIPLKIRNP